MKADPGGRVVLVPVRHHSPACARVVTTLVDEVRPDAVLIEGPSDYNDRIDELFLGHQLPIAIYSYVRLPGGVRRGAYYPFCTYSPEWQALQSARKLGAAVRFIDLPWAALADGDHLTQRYADARLKSGDYVSALCREVGVDDFDALWDELVEADVPPDAGAQLRRAGLFCEHLRRLDGDVGPSDRRREAFMAAQIWRALDEFPGRLLVVTGGYHTPALRESLDSGHPPDAPPLEPLPDDRGIALTPYSYERLDNLKGYESGMPNPGFYHQVWHDGPRGLAETHRRLLARVARVLRERKQTVSAADLIAAETTARGLAAVRGHQAVWRRDLVDGVTAALVKDESVRGEAHPLLDAVHEVFRGGERGRLAEGALLPPLVQDVRRLLAEHELVPEMRPRDVDLDLDQASGRTRSRLLHRLRLLGISGVDRLDGTDFASRDDLTRFWERWKVRWTPEHDATLVEASRYGPSLDDAAAARLLERAGEIERDAASAARLLLDAALAGVETLAPDLRDRLAAVIREDGQFLSVAGALGHLLYLHRYDATLGTRDRDDLGSLLAETFQRGLWLLEGLGQLPGQDAGLVSGVKALLEAFERGGTDLGLDRGEFVDVLTRVADDPSQNVAVRGAATGALWTLNAADPDAVLRAMLLLGDPGRIGDFLTGLFALAREAARRQPALILGLDALLSGYADEEFLEALPSLRLAFTYFTPREKHHMARSLLEALGVTDPAGMAGLEVRPEDAARAFALEARVFQAAARFGVRGATR